jgi:hypothetical protein
MVMDRIGIVNRRLMAGVLEWMDGWMDGWSDEWCE